MCDFYYKSRTELNPGHTASELIFGVGVGEARPEGPRAGDGVLGEGTGQPASPLPTNYGVCGSAISFFSGVRGRAPAAAGVSCIMSRQIAFPSISVRVALAYN